MQVANDSLNSTFVARLGSLKCVNCFGFKQDLGILSVAANPKRTLHKALLMKTQGDSDIYAKEAHRVLYLLHLEMLRNYERL